MKKHTFQNWEIMLLWFYIQLEIKQNVTNSIKVVPFNLIVIFF